MSAVLIDAANDRILYQKDAFKVMPMASTTKIMTAILALENGNPDDIVTVSKRAASMLLHTGILLKKYNLYLEVAEILCYTLNDALMGLLCPFANIVIFFINIKWRSEK